ncbi:MAG: hypothetical protein NC453_26660 [Muribaculum sp.]|nr:hypothetical protein [Muribaculum sp.]
MRQSFTRIISKLNFSKLSDGSLADYAYAISRCKFPASVNIDDIHQIIACQCEEKINELFQEIERRVGNHGKSAILDYALTVCHNPDAYYDTSFQKLSTYVKSRSKKRIVESFGNVVSNLDYSKLSDTELVTLHSLSPVWYDYRRPKEMEMFTRIYFWPIVSAIKDSQLADILLLTECMEAENYSQLINLKYRFGERVGLINLSDHNDSEIINRIETLTSNLNFTAREELIAIADYIQLQIVDKGESAEHIRLIHSILGVNICSFGYPKIVKSLEQVVNEYQEYNSIPLIEFAPIYKTLWERTTKSKYLHALKKIVRGCYLALTGKQSFPDLNIGALNPFDTAIRILKDNRDIMWVLDTRYDVERVIREYQPCAQ